jgi:hypothetical protein
MKAYVFIIFIIFFSPNLFAQYANDRQNTPKDYQLAKVDSIFSYDSIPNKPSVLVKIEVLDVNGNIVKVIDVEDNELTYKFYNISNQVISSYFYSSFDNDGVQRLIWVDTFEYNVKGQQTLYTRHDVFTNRYNSESKKFLYKNDTLWKTKLYFQDELNLICIYYYDEFGRTFKEVNLNEFGINDSTIFVYNDNSQLIDFKSYTYRYSKNINHQQYVWNSKGKKSTFLVFNQHNQLSMRYDFEYNSKNLLILDKYTSFDGDGNIKKGEIIYTVYRYSCRKE